MADNVLRLAEHFSKGFAQGVIIVGDIIIVGDSNVNQDRFSLWVGALEQADPALLTA